MNHFLTIMEVILALLLILVILMQDKDSGLSRTFGGMGGVKTTKRGVEKHLHYATVIIFILFLCNSIAFMFINR